MNARTDQQRPSGATHGGYFSHHGLWAPGVRTFRCLGFAAKAWCVSLGLLLPLLLLLAAYVHSTQQNIDFAQSERRGVVVLRQIEPWLVDVQRQRRLVSTGTATLQPASIVEAYDKLVAQLGAMATELDLSEPLKDLVPVHQALLTLPAGASALQTTEALQAYVDALRHFREHVLDASQISLDPQQATYYLAMASVDTTTEVIEAVSRSRALAGALQRDGSTAIGVHKLYALTMAGRTALDRMVDQFERASAAAPESVKALAVADAHDKTQEFLDLAVQPWFAERFDAALEALNGPGQQSVDALRQLSATGLDAFDRLLVQRIESDTLHRDGVLAATLLSIAIAAYLFISFYKVTQGGMNELERHLDAMMRGDLTTVPRPWGRDEAARLLTTLAATQASLRSIVGQVRAAAGGLVTASEEIAGASSDLSRRSEQAAASLEEAASAMHQIAATVEHTSNHTRRASALAERNAAVAGEGGRAIDAVVHTMSEVARSSERISAIVSVIDSIAFQTNLLALNAAVEAARAGEQGRGFAVVAGEVRALSQRTTGAAREVKSLILESVDKVRLGSSRVGEAGSQMRAMVESAQQMRQLMADVLTGADEQSSGIRLVHESIARLDHQTQQNAALVEQTAAAAGSLRDQSGSLAGEVARFRTEAAA